MANPQKEDGHVRIANEILDNLSKLFLNSREWNVLIFVIRKTYGFNKKFDKISLSQFEKGCNLNHGQVCKILPSLVSQRILLKTENGYGLNKNYEQWGVSQGRRGGLTADNKVVSQQTILPVSQQRHTKDTIKNTITKDSSKWPPKKIIDGEKYRGQFIWFDFFLDRCKAKNIAPHIRPDKFRALEDEYRNRVAWAAEVKGCIAYCFDHDLKFINAGRLRNRMEMAIKIEANRKRFDAEDKQDKKNGFVSQSLPKKQSQDELSNFQTCTVCQNCMTQNENAICNSCAT